MELTTDADAGGGRGVSLAARVRQGWAAGWSVVFGASMCMMVGAGLSIWALGIYVQPLETEFGWTRAEISFGTSITFLVGGITGPIVGLVIDRWGARRPVLIGAVALGGIYAAGAVLHDLWHFYLLYALMSFARSWVSYIPFLWMVTRWFPDRMGAPMGVMGLGFSLAGLVFVPLVTWLVAMFGWRATFAICGFLLTAITLPLAFALVKEPTAVPRRHGAPQQHPLPASATGITLHAALRTRAFWLLALATSTFFMGLTSFTFHSVPFFLSRGFSDAEAAGWVSAMAALGTAARIGIGIAVDRVRDLKRLAVVAGVAPALALTLLAVDSGPASMLVFVVLWSVGTSIGPLMESVLLARAFGTVSFGAILGALGVAETVGMIIGPLVGGAVYDATGGYGPALLFYAAGFAVTAVGFALGDYRERAA